jgi:hypothetical protein
MVRDTQDTKSIPTCFNTDMPPGPLQTFVTTVTLVPAQGGPGDTSVVPNPAANQTGFQGQSETAEHQDLAVTDAANNNNAIILGATIGSVAGLAIAIPLCLYAIWRCVGMGGKGVKDDEKGEKAIRKVYEGDASCTPTDDELRGCALDSANSQQIVVETLALFTAESHSGAMFKPSDKGDAFKEAKLWDIQGRLDGDFVIYADTEVNAERHSTTARALNSGKANKVAARRMGAGTQHPTKSFVFTTSTPSPHDGNINLVSSTDQSLEISSQDDEVIIFQPGCHMQRR